MPMVSLADKAAVKHNALISVLVSAGKPASNA